MKQPQTGRGAAPGTSTQTDRDDQALRKRSVTVAGHRTSISLEEAFWLELNRVAAARGQSVSALVSWIDRQRRGNLSSAIRVFVLKEIAAGREPDGAAPGRSS